MLVAQFGTRRRPISSSTTWLGPGVKVGGWLGKMRRIETGAEVALAPTLSVARAVRTTVPGGGFVQIKLKGAAVTPPILLVRLKYSTLVMVPSGSEALAVSSRLVG